MADTKTRGPDSDKESNHEFSQMVTREVASHLLRKEGLGGVRVTRAPSENGEKKKKLSPEEIEEAESRLDDEDLYVPKDESEPKRRRLGFRFRKRRNTVITITATGIISIAFGFFVITPQFKVPSLIGDIQINIPSGLILHMVINRSFKRIMTHYLIAKATGTSDAKPDSLMGRFYRVLDETGAPDKVFKDTGVRFKKVGSEVHAFHDGKDLGPANSVKEVKALEKKFPDTFGKSYGDVIKRTYPGIRLVLGIGLFNNIKIVYGVAFGTRYDDSKSKEENWADLEKREFERVTVDQAKLIGGGIGCMVAAANAQVPCPERSKQPVNTNNPSTPHGINFGGEPIKNPTVEAAADALEEAVEETAKAGPKDGSYTGRLMEILTQKIISAVGNKTLVAMIPVVGWIDTAAQIDHALEVAATRHLVTDTAILLKEQSYGKIAGMWLGYADEIKDGSMKWSYRFGLAERLTGYEASAAAAFLYGGDPSKRIPVDPKVGSSSIFNEQTGNALDNVLGCSDSANNNAQANLVSEYLNFTRCNSHFILNIWYQSVGRVLGAIGDLTSAVTFWIFEVSGAQTVLDEAMSLVFGPDWKIKAAQFAVSVIIKMFGADIDTAAKEGPLYNNIYTGMDVINNQYLETNLGAYEVSPKVAAANLRLAQENYRETLASLPLRDRLFSMDVPNSLTNQLIIAAPTSPDPGTMVASIIRPIKLLPSTFMSLLSGRSWAADSYQDRASLTGVAQMGFNTEEELDADIPIEVKEQADPKCPPNEKGKPNNCQRYKEILNSVMCFDPGCAAMPKY